MRKSKLIVYALMIMLAVAACSSNSDGNKPTKPLPFPAAPAAGLQGDGRLGELVHWAADAQQLPAMAVVVVERGQIVDIAAEGLRSIAAVERVTVDDAWHIGSLTKGLTATLVGVLVDMSVISWDTTPLDVWPELDAGIDDGFRGITVRQLLSHTAGIERVNSVASPYHDDADGSIVDKRRALAAELLAAGPAAPIGTHSYSNGGYIIVGAMLETVMSSSWETLLKDYVLLPLGMHDTAFGAPGSPGGLSQPWGHWDRNNRFHPVSPGPEADNPRVFGPAGTLHTTLTDYARFMVAHIDGWNGLGGFLSAESFTVLHTPVVDGSGLGWGITSSDDFPGRTLLAHAGSNQRWYAVVKLLPELDGGAFFVVNAGGERAAAAIDRMEDFVIDRYKALH